jgi:hypothetical protein
MMIAFPFRLWLPLALLIVVSTTTGCASMLGMSIGAAIGAAQPRYTPVERDDAPPPIGTPLRVRVAHRGADDEAVDGLYAGSRDGSITVSDAKGDRAIPLDTVHEVRTKESYLGLGLAAGAVVGAALDVGLFVALTSNRNCCGPH